MSEQTKPFSAEEIERIQSLRSQLDQLSQRSEELLSVEKQTQRAKWDVQEEWSRLHCELLTILRMPVPQ